MENIPGSYLPSTWQLHSGKPDDMNKVNGALDFFATHHEWVAEHPEESKRYFSLLSRTSLAASARKIYEALFLRYPLLFPLEVVLVETDKQLPQVRLTFQSPDSFDSDDIVVELKIADPELITFLKSEKISLGDVPKFLYFAEKNGNEELKKQCIAYIMAKLESCSLDQLLPFLALAVKLNLNDMLWNCLRQGLKYGKAHQEWNYYKEQDCVSKLNRHLEGGYSFDVKTLCSMLIDFRRLSSINRVDFEETPGEIYMGQFLPQKMEFLHCLGSFIPISLKVGSGFDYKVHSKLVKEIGKLKEFKCLSFFPKSVQEIKEYFVSLSPNAIITDLNLVCIPDLTNEDLFELAELLPNLKSLKIRNYKNITGIPFEMLESLECPDCGITKLSLPKAKYIDIAGCPKGIELNLPSTCRVNYAHGFDD